MTIYVKNVIKCIGRARKALRSILPQPAEAILKAVDIF